MSATLASLRIKNLALVSELEWEPGAGFIAITGETGAGKSVIIGALKLLVGERADRSLVRTGADLCAVESEFVLDEDLTAQIDPILEEQGVEPCEEGRLLLKRTVPVQGTGRQFVNGSGVTLALLKTLGDYLVDLHGPHDHQSLLSAERQLDLLDAFAGGGALRADFERNFREHGQRQRELQALSTDEAALEREVDLLTHQVREIDAAGLSPGEETTLETQYRVAANAKRLLELSSALNAALCDGEAAVLPRLEEMQRTFRELGKLDPAMEPLAQAHEDSIALLQDSSRELTRYGESLDLDEARLLELEERLNLLQTLKRKYGGTLQEVLRFREETGLRLSKITHRGEERARLEKEIEKLSATLRELGAKLSAIRKKSAKKLAGAIAAQLGALGFKASDFEVQLTPSETLHATGMETVEFLFSPNPGEPIKPLRAIGSSGEISRVMLAVKSALAEQDAVPLLVFDEIDANVGGEIATAVGKKMQGLASGHQVLCITHLPQVAALANRHFEVSKSVVDGRTISTLERVEGKKRELEIARMLGGKSDSALAHAKEMLG